MEQIRMILRDNEMEGYSFITDARVQDRVDVQAVKTEGLGSEPEAAYVGVKFQ